MTSWYDRHMGAGLKNKTMVFTVFYVMISFFLSSHCTVLALGVFFFVVENSLLLSFPLVHGGRGWRSLANCGGVAARPSSFFLFFFLCVFCVLHVFALGFCCTNKNGRYDWLPTLIICIIISVSDCMVERAKLSCLSGHCCFYAIKRSRRGRRMHRWLAANTNEIAT